MVTVPEVTEKIILSKPLLEEAIRSGIINNSALARLLKPEIESELMKPVQEGAIVMAIKRLVPTLNVKGKPVKKILGNITDITIKSNLKEITIKNSPHVSRKLASLLKKSEQLQSKFITFSQGVYEITIIISDNLVSLSESLFEQNEVILTIENISSLNIQLPKENLETPGVYYAILKELAWNNINLVEAISTSNEITIFFRQNEIEKAFMVLNKLVRKNQ